MENEDFYESAVRNWIGGCILEQNEEYDSAVCMQGFAYSRIPGIEAEDEIHFPELIPFNNAILHGIELFSDGSPEKNHRVNAYKRILTGESYKKITNRKKNGLEKIRDGY